MDTRDITIHCRGCGRPFVFGEGEQAFYQERGYRPPLYCPDCRDARRAASPAANAPARVTTTCSRCGRSTSVPFQPRAGKPVYCDDCFREQRRG